MKAKNVMQTILLIIGILIIVYTLYSSSTLNNGTINIVNKNRVQNFSEYNNNLSIVKEIGTIEVYFCPQDNCTEILYNFITAANNSLYCALYDLDLVQVIKVINNKSYYIKTKLVVDNNNKIDFNNKYQNYKKPSQFIKYDNNNQLMHNKFCIRDNNTVLTGSFNPTYNGAYNNNNNIIIINSKTVAKNYNDEFFELWHGVFGKGDRVNNPIIILNNYTVENYFCPEDNCQEKLLTNIKSANKSIYFMTFSFTDNAIGANLVLKLKKNISVKGIFESRQISKYSEYELLKYQGADIILDKNPKSMHHKVFIIDNRTVITGSYNPTKNGNTRNDENIIIINDPFIVNKFINEFISLYNKYSKP